MDEQTEMKFNEQMFYLCDDICLPYSIRTYLDSGADDFKNLDIDRKIFHLAYVVSHGYDLYGHICRDIEEHKEVYGNYEDIAQRSLLSYISYLRSGNKDDESYFILEHLSLKKIVTLLSRELLLRFEDDGVCYSFETFHYDYESIKSRYSSKEYQKHLASTLETEMNITLTEARLKHINGWRMVADDIHTMDYPCEKKYVYPGDEVSEDDKKGSEYQLRLNILPEPFTGNILHAKVVILSLNPAFVEHLNQKLPPMLNKETLKQFLSQRKASLKMEGSSIYKYEIEKIIGDYYWVDKLKYLAEKAEEKPERIYEKVAILQYLGYFSERYNPISKNVDLPSQWFAKLIVRYLSTKDDVAILILRNESEWKQIIDEDVWNQLEEHGRLIRKPRPTRTQDITPNNLKEAFEQIVNAIKP